MKLHCYKFFWMNLKMWFLPLAKLWRLLPKPGDCLKDGKMGKMDENSGEELISHLLIEKNHVKILRDHKKGTLVSPKGRDWRKIEFPSREGGGSKAYFVMKKKTFFWGEFSCKCCREPSVVNLSNFSYAFPGLARNSKMWKIISLHIE